MERTITLNQIKFTVTYDAGETWFTADRPLSEKQLQKAIAESGYTPKWESAENGNFSTYDFVRI